MSRISVQGRIRRLTIVSVLGFAAILALGVLQRRIADRELHALERARVATQSELGVRYLLESIHGNILALLLGKSDAAHEAQRLELEEGTRTLEQTLDRFENATADTPLAEDAQALSGEIRDAIEIANELAASGADDRLKAISLFGAYRVQQAAVFERADRLGRQAHVWSQQERRRAKASITWVNRVGFVGGVAIAGSAVAMILALGRRTLRSLELLRERVQRLADGDLEARWEGSASDEFEALERDLAGMASEVGQAVNRMGDAAGEVGQAAESAREFADLFGQQSREHVEQARSVFTSVQVAERGVAKMKRSGEELRRTAETSTESATELRAGSKELANQALILLNRVEHSIGSASEFASSSGQIAELAGGFARSIESVGQDVGEVAHAADEVARESEHADQLAAASLESADRGRRQILESLQGMGAIASAEAVVREQMQGLAHRIGEIDDLARLIEDVTAETGLLAFNAAIISAQAGNEGRAFAVVANEIGSLADRTAKTTKQILGVVEGVSLFTHATEQAIQESAHVVAREESRAQSAIEVLDIIHEGARETRERVSQISEAAASQQALCQRGSDGMQRISVSAGEILAAARVQEGATRSISDAHSVMGGVADVVRRASHQHHDQSEFLAESADRVRGVAIEIDQALDEQLRVNRETLSTLEAMLGYAQATSETLAEKVETLVIRCERLGSSLEALRT
ncbi:MAG: HAMP domain-containing protein [bacterium]|nr:HAMP domain-containing protein [bacterium]MCP5071245.1 HAMP domain-containing protein [bacterium]